jgi:Uma2 family endonuclease
VSTAAFEHVLPWTEDEYLSLGQTPDRVELLDGSLLVSPAPTRQHQTISRRLANIIEPAANAAGLEVYEAINIRLKPRRIPIPDVVVMRPFPVDDLVADASTVEMICEITSPSNAGTDKVLKLNHYAEAGIPWYLLVEPDPIALLLFRLDGDRYVEHAQGRRGQPLRLDAPVVADVDPAALER